MNDVRWNADCETEEARQAEQERMRREASERAAKGVQKTKAKRAAEREQRLDELAETLGIKREAADTVLSSAYGKASLFTLSEDSIARVFAHQFGETLRYSYDCGRWYPWDGTRWRQETTDVAFDYCRALCRSLNLEGKRQWQKASVAVAVERFARADRVFAMSGEEWDRHPFLLAWTCVRRRREPRLPMVSFGVHP